MIWACTLRRAGLHTEYNVCVFQWDYARFTHKLGVLPVCYQIEAKVLSLVCKSGTTMTVQTHRDRQVSTVSRSAGSLPSSSSLLLPSPYDACVGVGVGVKPVIRRE